jgi:hypothetical protein
MIPLFPRVSDPLLDILQCRVHGLPAEDGVVPVERALELFYRPPLCHVRFKEVQRGEHFGCAHVLPMATLEGVGEDGESRVDVHAGDGINLRQELELVVDQNFDLQAAFADINIRKSWSVYYQLGARNTYCLKDVQR